MKGVLSGVRVLDVTMAVAGPYGAMLLALLGAEVVKIESRRRLDLSRRLASVWQSGQKAASFNADPAFNELNLNKLSVTLNLTHPKAAELARQLAGASDVVMENMRPGVMERLGLSYPALRRINPTIIMLSSSACGSTGPERSYMSYAPIQSALGGVTHITGYTDGPPAVVRAPSDYMRGNWDAFAILAALHYRQMTGRGQFIDLSSREALSCLVGHTFMDYIMNGCVPSRRGNEDEGMAPHNCYPCQGHDRWVSIAVHDDAEWRALCQAAGHAEWRTDPRFASATARKQHEAELDEAISAWTRQHMAEEVCERLQQAGIAATLSATAADLLSDPQLRAQGAFQQVEHPEIGRKEVMGVPWRYSRTPATVRRHGPLLGEHNDDVLGGLIGLSSEEIQALADEQAVY